MERSRLKEIILEELQKANEVTLMESFASKTAYNIYKLLEENKAWNVITERFNISLKEMNDEFISEESNARRGYLNIFVLEENHVFTIGKKVLNSKLKYDNLLESSKEVYSIDMKSFCDTDVHELTESFVINEEYVELMDIDASLNQIVDAFNEWKEGPETEKSMIKGAKKELLDFVNSYLNKHIK